MAKFPYLFAARGIICTDYACCTNCKLSPSTFVSHNFARQAFLVLLATWDIASRKIVINCFSLALLARQDTDFVGMRNIAPPLSLRLGHRTALVLLTPFTTVLPLRYRVGNLVGRSKFPYKSRVARCPWDFLFCRRLVLGQAHATVPKV